MTLALYMDEHIPSAITDGLKARGLDVLTIQEDGRTGSADVLMLRRAYELRRVMVTEDHDFERIATEFWTSGVSFYGIAFVIRRGTIFGTIIADLEMLAVCFEIDEILNRVEYIPLR